MSNTEVLKWILKMCVSLNELTHGDLNGVICAIHDCLDGWRRV